MFLSLSYPKFYISGAFVMNQKYTTVEKEVITTVRTKEYIFTGDHEEKTIPKKLAHAFWKYLRTSFYNKYIKKHLTL